LLVTYLLTKKGIKAAITRNEIIESSVITARKTITVVIVTISLKRFGTMCPYTMI